MLGVSLVATLLPLFLHAFILTSLYLTAATILTAMIAIALCYVSYQAAVSGIQKLLNQVS